jgi:hypothetical protein
MGISGGDNWLAEWNYRLIICYAINGHEIINRISSILNDDLTERSRYDIMKDIPGTRIGTGASTFGDFNGDGLDEIFQYAFAGMGEFISFIGYDERRNKFDYYCSIHFALVDSENGPAPFEFMTYQGVDGFKVYQDIYNSPPIHPSKHKVNNVSLSWYFYAWDEGSRKYVELAEIGEDIDYSMFTKPEEAEQPVEAYTETVPLATTDTSSEPETPASGEPVPAGAEQQNTVPIVGIGGGILALILVVCGILLIRRKK